jgi:Flp pilus assembly protein TadD
VRQEAASVLAGLADSLKSPESRRSFEAAAAEFVASQQYNADRAENRAMLGVFYLERGRVDSAEIQFRVAVKQWPQFVDGYIDLAGLLSLRKHEGDAQRVLRDAMTRIRGEPRLHHALGLSLARSGRLQEATKELEEANQLSSFDPEFAYPYAVVLHGTGRVRDAVRVLEASRRVAPSNRDVLYALSTFARDVGDTSTALRYAKELAQAFPRDAKASALLRSLQSRAP